MKKLKFRHNGKVRTIEGNSHAVVFRDFFEYWKEADLEKTIHGTFNCNLRISSKEYFEGTVIKKKNLLITDGLYIITHITPSAMDKGIVNFLHFLDVEIVEPKKFKKKTENELPLENLEIEPNEKVQEEIKAIAASLAENPEDHDKKDMKMVSALIEKRMAERNANIKARLQKGNRPQV